MSTLDLGLSDVGAGVEGAVPSPDVLKVTFVRGVREESLGLNNEGGDNGVIKEDDVDDFNASWDVAVVGLKVLAGWASEEKDGSFVDNGYLKLSTRISVAFFSLLLLLLLLLFLTTEI